MATTDELTREFQELQATASRLADSSPAQADLIAKLATTIKHHKMHYYQGQPLIEDAVYDELEAMLTTLSPHHPMLQYVGYNNHGKIKHQIPMLSLEKVRDYPALTAWAQRHAATTIEAASPCISTSATYKLDGVSLSLIYAQGRLLTCKTRGDGSFGEDVTAKLLDLPSIPHQLKPADAKESSSALWTQTDLSVEIRGELCCSRANFTQLKSAMIARNLKPPSSERNIVAGVLGRKDHLDLTSYFTFLAFSVDHLQLFHIKQQLDQLIEHHHATEIRTHLPQLAPFASEADLAAMHALVNHDLEALRGKVMQVSLFQQESAKLTWLERRGLTPPPLAPLHPNQTNPTDAAASSPPSSHHRTSKPGSSWRAQSQAAAVIQLPCTEPVICTYHDGQLSLISLGRLSCSRPHREPLFKVPATITAEDLPATVKILGQLKRRGSMAQLKQLYAQLPILGDSSTGDESFMFQTVMQWDKPEKEHHQLREQFLAQYEFQAYGLTSSDDGRSWLHETDKLSLFQHNNFMIAEPYLRFANFLEGARKYAHQGEYCIDGVVLTIEDTSAHQQIGYTAHHPKYRICYKWQGDEQPTTIKDIRWEVSRTGCVSPIAVLTPVKISGATIQRVSLHNYRYFMKLSLRTGDEVYVIRSGDVIPKITRIKRKSHPKAGPPWQPPTHCPECSVALTFATEANQPKESADPVVLMCPNTTLCPPQITGSINHWCRSVKIYDLSNKRIRQLVDLGLLTSIADLYRLSIEDLANMDGMALKMATKIITSIHNAKHIPLVNMLVGLGITGLQKTMAQKIVTNYPSMDMILALDDQDLNAIAGLAEKSATAILTELRELRPLLAALYDLGVTVKLPGG